MLGLSGLTFYSRDAEFAVLQAIAETCNYYPEDRVLVTSVVNFTAPVALRGASAWPASTATFASALASRMGVPAASVVVSAPAAGAASPFANVSVRGVPKGDSAAFSAAVAAAAAAAVPGATGAAVGAQSVQVAVSYVLRLINNAASNVKTRIDQLNGDIDDGWIARQTLAGYGVTATRSWSIVPPRSGNAPPPPAAAGGGAGGAGRRRALQQMLLLRGGGR